ncbi:hypothetical protein LWI29_023240 [Acer saccharum]|uniref:RNase H type-1 domain-containing protein n=1 Tax=Acer saccharum TaxID=4024 RepID=A0AA39VJ42_ACESA|nr:hypothetical protein LWI29_023240 [Acer saccharum]
MVRRRRQRRGGEEEGDSEKKKKKKKMIVRRRRRRRRRREEEEEEDDDERRRQIDIERNLVAHGDSKQDYFEVVHRCKRFLADYHNDEGRRVTANLVVNQNRNSGFVLASCSLSMAGCFDANLAEIMAIYRGLVFSSECGLKPCVLESDAAVAVNWINEGSHRDSANGNIFIVSSYISIFGTELPTI